METSKVEPLGESERLERFYRKSRQATLDSIARDSNWDWLMQNIRFGTQRPNYGFISSGEKRSDKELEFLLQDLWWRTIEAAKLYPADDEMRQWNLVAWIAGAKARGPVASKERDPYSADDGKILWNDLPFFEPALERAWADRQKLSKSEWYNLNAFVARLVAVTGLDLLHLGLETVREALEESRSVLPTAERQDTIRSVSDLLPAALCWFKYHTEFLRTMIAATERALKNGDELPSKRRGIPPGELALAAGVSREGLSLARQRFWRLRLVEIGSDKQSEKDGDTTVEVAHDWARRLWTWNLTWPHDLKDVPGWEEPVQYKDSS